MQNKIVLSIHTLSHCWWNKCSQWHVTLFSVVENSKIGSHHMCYPGSVQEGWIKVTVADFRIQNILISVGVYELLSAFLFFFLFSFAYIPFILYGFLSVKVFAHTYLRSSEFCFLIQIFQFGVHICITQASL